MTTQSRIFAAITRLQSQLVEQKKNKRRGLFDEQQPLIVRLHRHVMDGVNFIDCSFVRTKAKNKGKKFFCTLFMNVLNLSFVLPWRIFQLAYSSTIS